MKYYTLTIKPIRKKKNVKNIVFDRNSIGELIQVAQNCHKDLTYEQTVELIEKRKVRNGSFILLIEEKESIL